MDVKRIVFTRDIPTIPDAFKQIGLGKSCPDIAEEAPVSGIPWPSGESSASFIKAVFFLVQQQLTASAAAAQVLRSTRRAADCFNTG